MNTWTSVLAIAVSQGTVKGCTRRARLGALLGVWGLLSLSSGCGSQTSESSRPSAEAHGDGQDASALPSDGGAPDGGEVTDSSIDASSGAVPSTDAGLADSGGAPSEPPIDGLPTPEGWDGLTLIDPYSDACSISSALDRDTDPDGEEGLCALSFACAGGPELSATCSLQDDGANEGIWDCSCNGQARTASSRFSFQDNGLTEIEACRTVGALCVTELPPELARAQELCGPESQTLDPDSCRHQSDCVRTVTVGDVVLEQTLENQATCSWDSDDVAMCSCAGVLNSVAPILTSRGMSDESCRVATSLCNDGVDAGTLGEIECTRAAELSGMDELWCDETYECAQPAVVEGSALEFGRQLRGGCNRANPSDAWECHCWEDDDRTLVDAPDATTACQMNLQRCVELQGGDLREW
jgi:hypothetical protein